MKISLLDREEAIAFARGLAAALAAGLSGPEADEAWFVHEHDDERGWWLAVGSDPEADPLVDADFWLVESTNAPGTWAVAQTSNEGCWLHVGPGLVFEV